MKKGSVRYSKCGMGKKRSGLGGDKHMVLMCWKEQVRLETGWKFRNVIGAKQRDYLLLRGGIVQPLPLGWPGARNPGGGARSPGFCQ